MKASIAWIVWLFPLVSGCTHTFSTELLRSADRTIRYADLQEHPDSFIGKTVITGGVIAGMARGGDEVTLEVVQFDLGPDEVPQENLKPGGRFLATAPHLDPKIYRPGRLVTLIGEVKGKRTGKVEESDYVWPLLTIREIRPWEDETGEDLLIERYNPYYWGYPDERYKLRPAGPVLRR
jgi:outer membrane lipoprotein